MLSRLSIRNIVLIEALDLDFARGLGVLTGETGAGKSILLDALAIPRQAFTPIFAVARSAGWTAHAREQQRGGRLIRPSSAYIGPMPGLRPPA